MLVQGLSERIKVAIVVRECDSGGADGIEENFSKADLPIEVVLGIDLADRSESLHTAFGQQIDEFFQPPIVQLGKGRLGEQ